jgi:cysteine sulfinate desulfinase/cysteine desulfurase-like protein
MLANNETGTIQLVAELAHVAHERGVPLHTDAAQTVGKVPVDIAASAVRLSLGRWTTGPDIDRAAELLIAAARRLR